MHQIVQFTCRQGLLAWIRYGASSGCVLDWKQGFVFELAVADERTPMNHSRDSQAVG